MQKAFIIFLLILFIIGVGLTIYINESQADEISEEEFELYDYIDWWFKDSTKNKSAMKRADFAKKEIVPLILKYSKIFKVDHLMIAVTISAESSWTPGLKGEKGEVGLMQVMNGKKGLKEEIFNGIRILKLGLDKCKNNTEVFSYYISGTCKRLGNVKRKAVYRNQHYKEAINRHREIKSF